MKYPWLKADIQVVHWTFFRGPLSASFLSTILVAQLYLNLLRLVQKRLARVPGSTLFAGVSTGLGTIDDSYKINTTGDATMEL